MKKKKELLRKMKVHLPETEDDKANILKTPFSRSMFMAEMVQATEMPVVVSPIKIGEYYFKILPIHALEICSLENVIPIISGKLYIDQIVEPVADFGEYLIDIFSYPNLHVYVNKEHFSDEDVANIFVNYVTQDEGSPKIKYSDLVSSLRN